MIIKEQWCTYGRSEVKQHSEQCCNDKGKCTMVESESGSGIAAFRGPNFSDSCLSDSDAQSMPAKVQV